MTKEELAEALASYPERLKEALELLAVVRQEPPNIALMKANYEHERATYAVAYRQTPPEGMKPTESAIEALLDAHNGLHLQRLGITVEEYRSKHPPEHEVQAQIKIDVLRAELETLKLLTQLWKESESDLLP